MKVNDSIEKQQLLETAKILETLIPQEIVAGSYFY